MKITVPMLFVISMAVAGAMMGGSGVNDVLGHGMATGLSDDADELENQTQFQADRTGGDTSYLGMSVNAVGAMVGMLEWSLMFPVVMVNVGFPGWFAYPIGLPIQLINYVGIWQIVRGMTIR